MEDIPVAAVILGMVLGTLMIGAVMWTWLRTKAFGVGGAMLTIFGVLLIGLSLWTTVRIKVSADGLEATFDQRLARVESTVQHVDQRVTDVRSDVTAAISSVPNVPPDELERLRMREKVDKLMRDEKYAEVLRLDPNHPLALSYLVSKYVEKGMYQEAVALHQRLKSVSFTGTAYSAYSDLALAYEKLGHHDVAIHVLTDIDARVAYDIQKGGWLAGHDQVNYIVEDLKAIRPKIRNDEVLKNVNALIQKLEQTVSALK